MINTDNYELYFFRYAEGMLGEEERREVEAFLQQRPDLAEALQLYAEAPKVGREAVCFPGKESLKRSELKPRFMWWKAAAAVAAIAAVCVALFDGIDQPRTPQMAEALPSKTVVRPMTNDDTIDMLPSQRPDGAVEITAPALAFCTRPQTSEAPLLAENGVEEVANEALSEETRDDEMIQTPLLAENVAAEADEEALPEETWDDEEGLLDPVATMALAQAILAEYTRAHADRKVNGEMAAAVNSQINRFEDVAASPSNLQTSQKRFYEGLQARIDSRLVPLSASFAEVSVEVACLFSNIKEVYQSFEEIASQPFQSGWMQKIEDIL